MLDHDAIAARIPHAGQMCLLERVRHWDAQGIDCVALSHRAPDNPLRTAQGLPVWAGIEYAAQAAAVHSALVQARSTARSGVLAAVRNVVAATAWLDQLPGELCLSATQLHGDAAGAIYRFEVKSDDNTVLSGQFTLMFHESGGIA